jgi:hypothetical protein
MMQEFRRVEMNALQFVCRHDGGKDTGQQALEEGQSGDIFYPVEGIKGLLEKKM